jgi:general secretion pathway protein C
MDAQRLITLALGRYRWALNLALLTIAAFFLAKTINVFIYRAVRELPSLDAQPVKRAALPAAITTLTPAAAVQQILTRNLMQARREIPEPEAGPAKPVDTNRQLPCSLGTNIMGIVSANNSEWSYVVYRDPKTQESGLYAPREGRNKIPGEITLLEVYPGEAKFRKEDHIEVCVLGDDGKQPPVPEQPQQAAAGEEGGGGEGINKVSENEYAIEQKKIQWVQEHLNEVATDARIVPAFKDGKSDGFKLFSIRPGSVYQQIGLQNGDVIQKINGYEMNSPDKALEVYGKLRDARAITVQLERRGAPKTLTYQIR